MAGYVGGGGGANPMQRQRCLGCGQACSGGTCGGCNQVNPAPFIAVFDVGQGNCNALVGNDGRIVAYFDFGYSTKGDFFPKRRFRACFCADPAIILSHWDADHINLAKHEKKSLGRRWIVPEQNHSGFAGQVQGWIKAAGGELCVWPMDGANQAHATFPWGWLERCTQDPKRGINGSGLAAFVCVRDSVANQVVPALPSHKPASVADARKPARRAKEAVGVLRQQYAGNPYAIAAEPLAAMLAAANPMSTANAQFPVAQCADAALVATASAVSAQAVVQALGAAGCLASYTGNKTPIFEALADAAIAAAPKTTPRAKAVAAARQLLNLKEKSIDEDAWYQIGPSAIAAARGLAPVVRQNAAPFHADERFVLLNGDCNFDFVGTMTRFPKPQVVGMTAMHHGAIFEDGSALAAENIPFAPGAPVTKAIVRFTSLDLQRSAIGAISRAAHQLKARLDRHARRRIRVGTSRAARAAACAVWAMETAHSNELNAAPDKFAAVAAAAAAAAWSYRDARIVGLAAALASTTERVSGDTDTSPIEGVVDLAAEAIVAGRQNVALDLDGLRSAGRGAIDGCILPHVAVIVGEMVKKGSRALNPDNAGGEAATAHQILVQSYRQNLSAKKASEYRKRAALVENDQAVINDLATAATAALECSQLPPQGRRWQLNRHEYELAATAAGASLGLTAIASTPVRNQVRPLLQASYGAVYGGVNSIAFKAATLAAEWVAARIAGTRPEFVRTVLRTAASLNRHAEATRAANLPDNNGGRIAYSYGVHKGDFGHEYRSIVAGDMGHPHPLAVLKYEAHGWTQRRNASTRANHGGPQGDIESQHPCGDAALAWDAVNDEPAAPGRLEHRCPDCGARYQLRR